MTEEKHIPKENILEIERFYEQPPDAISFFSDMAQVIHTGNEILLQFYENIPGPPGKDGHVKQARTLLRATVTLTIPHAQNLGKLLTERAIEVKK